ncbi:RM46 protein, partial [Mystacornis crossleyi]|nr:RM46 protein [Mystacornis crossleyi]
SAAARRPWRLFGAMCLLRLPRITQPLEKEEEEMAALMEQVEGEHSCLDFCLILCIHICELLLGVQHRGLMNQDNQSVLPGDFVCSVCWFFADADKSNDRTSLNRKLDSNLMLLVKQKIGNQELWLLPQVEWQPGETLRSTAERAMATFLGDHVQAKVLGNAPYGIYKYKFPKAIRTEDNMGAKVFFFKAFLQSNDLSQTKLKADYLWVTKKELGDYLKSEYLKKVNRFLLD